MKTLFTAAILLAATSAAEAQPAFSNPASRRNPNNYIYQDYTPNSPVFRQLPERRDAPILWSNEQARMRFLDRVQEERQCTHVVKRFAILTICCDRYGACTREEE